MHAFKFGCTHNLSNKEIQRNILVCILLWTLLGHDLSAGATISNLVLATARREARVMQELFVSLHGVASPTSVFSCTASFGCNQRWAGSLKAHGEEHGFADGMLARPVYKRIAYGKEHGFQMTSWLNPEMGLEAGCACEEHGRADGILPRPLSTAAWSPDAHGEEHGLADGPLARPVAV